MIKGSLIDSLSSIEVLELDVPIFYFIGFYSNLNRYPVVPKFNFFGLTISALIQYYTYILSIPYPLYGLRFNQKTPGPLFFFYQKW